MQNIFLFNFIFVFYSKSFKTGVSDGIESGIQMGNFIAKKGGEALAYGAGAAVGALKGAKEANIKKSFEQGVDDGKFYILFQTSLNNKKLSKMMEVTRVFCEVVDS